VSRVATLGEGATGIDRETVRHLQVLRLPATSFDPQENEGQVRDRVGQSGAVMFLAVISALP
jgi:hypothetical protein